MRLVLAALAVLAALGPDLSESQTVEWPSYAHDLAGTKYSPLDQIDASNFSNLEIVWRQPVIPDAIRTPDTSRGPNNSQNTPLMAGGLLYVSTGLGTVAALDPTTGALVWHDDEPVFRDKATVSNSGPPSPPSPSRSRAHRGAWRTGPTVPTRESSPRGDRS